MPPVLLQLGGLLVGLALFAYWFAYVLGAPLGPDPDPGAIGFWLPYLLAKRRLRGALFDDLVETWREELRLSPDAIGHVEALRAHRRQTVVEGRKLFTWERSLLCPVCLHWWLSVAAGIAWGLFAAITWDAFCAYVLAYLFTHLFIRKI